MSRDGYLSTGGALTPAGLSTRLRGNLTMNDATGRRRTQPLMPRPRTGLLAIVALIALLAVACSGSSSPGGSGHFRAASGSASPPPASGSASPSAAGSARPPTPRGRVTPQQLLAYSECMRSHGVPGVPTSFPSPPGGNDAKSAIPAGSGPNPGSPQWQAANQACQSILPATRLAG